MRKTWILGVIFLIISLNSVKAEERIPAVRSLDVTIDTLNDGNKVVHIDGNPIGDEQLIKDILSGINKMNAINQISNMSNVKVDFQRWVNADVAIERWNLNTTKDYFIMLNFNPPIGFPQKVQIRLFNDLESAEAAVATIVDNKSSVNGDAKTTRKVDADEYYSEGVQFLQNGEFQKALDAFVAFDNLQPGDASVYNNMGMAYKKLGDNERALQYFQKALEIKPDSSRYIVNLAFYYYDLGKCDLALPYFKKALNLDSQMNGLSQYIDECSRK